MIYIEVSVEPHSRHCEWDGVKLKEGSRPPHTIISEQFETWEAALVWWKNLGIKTDSDVMTTVLEQGAKDNEYVGHEIEVLELTGQEYTCASVSIEGHQHVGKTCTTCMNPEPQERAND